MKLVYRNETNTLVNHAKNILENEGIKVILKNEHASTGMHPQFMYLELWVENDSDEENALNLLSILDSNESSPEWVCPECDEKNDVSFEICWSCKYEHKQSE